MSNRKWTGEPTKANPISGDKILILDSEDNNNNKLAEFGNLSTALPNWSTIVAIQNVNFGGVNLIDINQLRIKNQGTGIDSLISSDDPLEVLTVSGTLDANSLRSSGNIIGFATDALQTGRVTDVVAFADAINVHTIEDLAYVPSPTNNSITSLRVLGVDNPTILNVYKNDIDFLGATSVVFNADKLFITTATEIIVTNLFSVSDPVIFGRSGPIGNVMSDIIIKGKYAYVVPHDTDEFKVLSISDSFNLTVIATLPLTRNVTQMYENGSFIYMTSNIGGGVFIVDITNPLAPVLVNDFTDVTTLPVTYGISIAGNHMFVSTHEGLRIYDIVDKQNISEVGSVIDNLVHTDLVASDNHIYLSNLVKTVDVTDFTSPTVVGSTSFVETGLYLFGKSLYAVGNGNFSEYDITGAQMPAASIGSLHCAFIDVTGTMAVTGSADFHDSIHVGAGGIHTDGALTASNICMHNNNRIEWDNVAVDDKFGWTVNANDTMVTDASILNISPNPVATPTLRMLVDAQLPNNSPIGLIEARTLSSLGGEKQFARIQFFLEDSTNATANGSIFFTALHDNSTIDYIKINDGSNDLVKIRRILDMEFHKIINVTDPTASGDAATKNYVDTEIGAIIHPDNSDWATFIASQDVDIDGNTITNIGNDKFLEWNSSLGIKINTGNDLETNAQDFIMSQLGGTPKFFFKRLKALSPGNVIGNFRMAAHNSVGAEINYTQMRFRMEDDTNGSEHGSYDFNLLLNGLPTDALQINPDKEGTVKLGLPLDANTNFIINLKDPVNTKDATTKVYVDNLDTANSAADQLYADTQDDSHSLADRAYTDSQDSLLDPLWASHVASQDVDLDNNRLLNVTSISGVSDELQVIAKDFKINKTGTSQQMFFQRDEIMSNNQTIGIIRAESQDAGGTLRPFARIRLRMMDSTTGADHGSIEFNTRFNGGNKDWIYINDLGDGLIRMKEDTHFEDNDITNVNSLGVTTVNSVTSNITTGNITTVNATTINATGIITANDDIISKTIGSSAIITMERDEQIVGTLGQLNFEGQNDNSDIERFASIIGKSEVITAGLEEGFQQLRVLHLGNNTNMIELNEGGSGETKITVPLDMDGQEIKNAILENASANYTYVKTEEDFGVIPTASISAFGDAGSGVINVSSVGHGLITGNRVTISGTTSYNGDHDIIRVNANLFTIVDTFVATETGTFAALKRQTHTVGNENIMFFILADITLNNPLLFTPTNSEDVMVVLHTDENEFNSITVAYTDTALGSPYQGKGIFAFSRKNIRTIGNATLSAANIRSLDMEFTSVAFEFSIFVDDTAVDLELAGIEIKDAQLVTLKNSGFYGCVGIGHKFTNVAMLDILDCAFGTDSGITTSMIEIVDTVRPTSTRFRSLDMGILFLSGKSAFDISSSLDSNSRVSVTNCSIPAIADLFNSGGLDETDVRVLAQDNIGHKSSLVAGGWKVAGNTTATTIATVGTYVDFDFTSSNASALSFNESLILNNATNGEIKHTGKEPKVLHVPLQGFYTTTAAVSKTYKIKLQIDTGSGYADTTDNIETPFDISATGSNIRIAHNVFVNEGDLVKWQITQVSAGAIFSPTFEDGANEIPNT